jgi:hypothetical protein
MTYWDYIQTDAFKYPNPKDNTSWDQIISEWVDIQDDSLEMKQISYCENIETVFLQKD